MALNQDILTDINVNGYSKAHRRRIARSPVYLMVRDALALLRRYSQDAHIYLPGVGMLNGLQAGNYLDSAGTTQGTVDQPVGLVLDAAGGLGAELVTNGDFSNGLTGWVARTGATISNPVAGRLRVTPTVSAANFGGINTAATTIVTGKTYRISLEMLTNVNARTIQLVCGGAFIGNISAITSHSFVFVASGTAGPIIELSNQTTISGDYYEVSNISVREVTGIAASQPTTSAKPIQRRGAVNLAEQSTNFAASVWALEGGATKSGQTLLCGTDGMRAWQGSSLIGAQTFAVALSGSGTCTLFGYNGTDAGGGSIAQKQITLTAIPTIYTTSATVTAVTGWRFGRLAGDTATSITFQAGAIFQGTYTAQQIQALGGIPTTTTAPASTALGTQYWQFDGSNDSLSLGGPLFQMADDHCVVAGGLYAGSTASNNVVASPSQGASGNTRAGQIAYDSSVASVQSSWYDGANYDNLLFSYPPNLAFVCTAARRGATGFQRVNGIQRNSKTLTASFVSDRGSLGAYSQGDSFFPGNIYPVIVIKGTVPDADLLLLEKFVGQLSGVQI